MLAVGRRPLVGALAFAAILALPACAGEGSSGDAASGEGVEVTLRDFAVDMQESSVPAGSTSFTATNEGPSVHELEIFSVPEGVDATDLPIEDNVADTEAAGLEVIDEVEDVAPSTSASLTVSLSAGTYAAICNLPGHYAQGMVDTFTVG